MSYVDVTAFCKGYVERVKDRYVSSDMTIEQFELDLDIAFRLENGDIPDGGFTLEDGFPLYLADTYGRVLFVPEFV